MSTYFQSKEDATDNPRWVIVDAANKPVGRVASKVAALLRGKDSPKFTKHVNGGSFVIVLNASKAVLTGKKRTQKIYAQYSGYIGGLVEKSADELFNTNPERIIVTAVKGMLPHGALGHRVLQKLKVYSGIEHPHAAQKPEVVEISL